jgi:hypothetical protein
MPYEEALRKTDPKQIDSIQPASPQEKDALDRFAEFFSDLSEERVQAQVTRVYAPQAYLNDNLKEHTGIEQIRDYFVQSARAVESCNVRIDDMARSGGEYYVRWTMDIRFKKLAKGNLCRSIGISHLRFDAQGRVVFHQDYWDSATGFFQYVPVVGFLIKKIRQRI